MNTKKVLKTIVYISPIFVAIAMFLGYIKTKEQTAIMKEKAELEKELLSLQIKSIKSKNT